MLLLSTPGASFTFDQVLQPVPPPILSSLQDLELRLYFERFAAFLYQAKLNGRGGSPKPLPDPLSGAIFDLCVSHLLQMSGTAPVTAADSYVDGAGKPVTNPRCVLREPVSATESLPALIVRRFEETRVASPANAYDFQLYLYLALNYFFVWYCTEIHSTVETVTFQPPGTAGLDISCHRPALPIRNYVQACVRLAFRVGKPKPSNSWFSSTWFLNACTLEYPAELTINDLKNWATTVFGTKKKRKFAAIQLMAETIRGANIALLQNETKAIIGRLVGQPSGAGTALVDAYRDFSMYGLGDGTGTTALFGKTSYGLAFFNYLYEPDLAKVARVCVSRTVTVPLRQKDHDAVALFYFGLENNSLAKPSIRLTPLDESGRQSDTGAERTVETASSEKYVFARRRVAGQPEDKPSTSNVTPFWFNQETVAYLQADMMTDPLPTKLKPHLNAEEVVFIVFKHRMGERPPASVRIEAEWTFNDNRFAKIDAIGGSVFSGQARQDALKLIISQVVVAPNVDVWTFMQGWGVGESLNRPAADPGCDLARSADQADTQVSEPRYTALRYCHGRLYWSSSEQTLWFSSKGFVSPLRATWDPHLAATPTVSLTREGSFGQFLKPTSQPSYNCVLSAFRAFSICEAMMQAMIDKAVEMALDSEITQDQADTLIASLTVHLTQEAIARILTPDGGYLMRHTPEQEIVVTHEIFHSFVVQ